MATLKAATPSMTQTTAPWPKWKDELMAMLDMHTAVPLVAQLRSGDITENVSLFLNLNLSTLWLQGRVKSFNDLIKKYSVKKNPKAISNSDLGTCDSLADLVTLVGSRM